jgi:hypothetical protein
MFRLARAAAVSTVATLGVALGGAVPVRAAPFAEATCFADWSDAAPLVAAHNLTPAKGLHDLARRHVPGDLVRVTLCREETRFVYRLLVRQAGGHLSHVTVDAQHPFAPW